MNKKIVFLFIGSDVRYAKAFQQEFKKTNIPWPTFLLKEDINQKILFIRNIELNVNHIYSLPDQAGLQVRPYDHLYLPYSVNEVVFNYPDHIVPKIVHAPSNPLIKGTAIIKRALEELRNEGLTFEFILLQNKSNIEVKEILLNSDIVIDQIYLHGPGMFGLEAMASGCALATKYFQKYMNIFNPPACYIDETEILKNNLRELIINREYRRSLAFKGRKFVEQNNDPVIISKKILNDLELNEPAYTPDFFIESFELHTNEKLTKNVKYLNEIVIKRFRKDKLDINSLKKRRLV